MTEELKIAQAIEGPHNLNNIAPPSQLQILRKLRWDMLSRQQQNYRLRQAQAALNAMKETTDG
jgi:hypothetical protein